MSPSMVKRGADRWGEVKDLEREMILAALTTSKERLGRPGRREPRSQSQRLERCGHKPKNSCSHQQEPLLERQPDANASALSGTLDDGLQSPQVQGDGDAVLSHQVCSNLLPYTQEAHVACLGEGMGGGPHSQEGRHRRGIRGSRAGGQRAGPHGDVIMDVSRAES